MARPNCCGISPIKFNNIEVLNKLLNIHAANGINRIFFAGFQTSIIWPPPSVLCLLSSVICRLLRYVSILKRRATPLLSERWGFETNSIFRQAPASNPASSADKRLPWDRGLHKLCGRSHGISAFPRPVCGTDCRLTWRS